MADLREEFGGAETKQILSHRARIIRSRLAGSFEGAFQVEEIDLEPTSAHSRLAMYEPGHAFGTTYDRERLPLLQRS